LKNTFTLYSIYGAALIFLTTVIVALLQIFIVGDQIKEYYSSTVSFLIQKLVDALTQSIVILIVAIPEGLPMTVTVSLAFSIKMMMRDHILVRDFKSPEVMAEIDDVIVGKTGCITVPEMNVATMFFQNHHVKNSRSNTFLNCMLTDESIELIIESILFNSIAKVQINDDCKFESIGGHTETALFNFL
jgi:P-type E1-E2 ATPase